MFPFAILLLAVFIISFATAVSVAVWVAGHRRERESFYRSEERRKAIEQGTLAQLEEVFREDERIAQRRGREGLKVVGLILTAVGVVIPIGVAMRGEIEGAVFSSMTLMIGIALLVYVYALAPKPDGKGQ
jgi:hypothetical protein